MLREERGDVGDSSIKREDGGDRTKVSVKNMSAKWNVEEKENTLTDISFDVQEGHLLAIIGPVGSGKVIIIWLQNLSFLLLLTPSILQGHLWPQS